RKASADGAPTARGPSQPRLGRVITAVSNAARGLAESGPSADKARREFRQADPALHTPLVWIDVLTNIGEHQLKILERSRNGGVFRPFKGRIGDPATGNERQIPGGRSGLGAIHVVGVVMEKVEGKFVSN